MERLESSPLSVSRKKSGEDSRRSIRFAISVTAVAVFDIQLAMRALLL
jgi:hypothetical protein